MTTFQASSANPLFTRVAQNFLDLQRRIESTGCNLDDVRIVGVTKTFGSDVVRVAQEVGITCVGENYVEELELKRGECEALEVSWHYLGALQTNKISRITKNSDLICGVSRLKEIEKIADAKDAMAIYVQVDFSGATGRNGAVESEIEALVNKARNLELNVRGLMCVSAPGKDAARLSFSKLVALADSLGLKERSIGMTDDLEIACEAGSTEVRVGRALFGARS